MKIIIIVFALLGGMAHAQENDTVDQSAPCSGPNHQSFGFWVGHWEVTQKGEFAGRNHIQWIDNGCAMLEHWKSANGSFTGHSLNFYDRDTGRWHQTWVDSSGTVLKLNGDMETDSVKDDNSDSQSMVLRGKRKLPGGEMQENRISWTPNPDGTVRQHWVQSNDGETWTTVFDGLYRRSEKTE